MIRAALDRPQAYSETTATIGDRVDTDIVAELESLPPTGSGLNRRPCRRALSQRDRAGTIANQLRASPDSTTATITAAAAVGTCCSWRTERAVT